MRQCEHGLLNCAMPVLVKGEHIATLFMGQFLFAPLDRPTSAGRRKALQIDAQAYLGALGQVPVIAEDRLRVVLTAQARLAQILATLGWGAQIAPEHLCHVQR